MESDLAYFRRRASDERTAALEARQSEARRLHVEMAERYEDLVRGIVASHQQLGIGMTDDPLRSLLPQADV